MERPKDGEIWLAKFPFMEKEETKIRPVLVLRTTPFGADAVFCGSHHLENRSPTGVTLNKDEAAALGLHRPSRIDFAKTVQIVLPDFIKKIGEIGMPGERISVSKFRELAYAAKAAHRAN